MKHGFLCVFTLLLLAGCGHKNAEDGGKKPAPLPVVSVVRVGRQTLDRTLPVTGTLAPLPNREAVINPPIAGVLDALPVKLGQPVARGQVVAQLSTQTLQGQIMQAQADLNQSHVQVAQAQANAEQQAAQTRTAIDQAASAVSAAIANLHAARATLAGDRAALQNAQQSLARQQKLLADGLVAEKDVEAGQLAVRSAQAQADAQEEAIAAQAQTVQGQRQALAAAQAGRLQDVVKRQDVAVARQEVLDAAGALATARAQERLCTLRAPLSGRVTEINASVGESVDASAKVVTVADLSQMLLQIALPSGDAPQVHPGDPVTFTVAGLPGRTFSTQVRMINPQVDAATGTVTALAVVPNPDRALQDDSTVRVQIVTTRLPDVVTVPQSAVLTDPQAGATTVVTIGADGLAHVRPVTVGLTAHGSVEIQHGLQPGETVAVSGQYGLPDGTAVRVQNAAGSGAAP